MIFLLHIVPQWIELTALALVMGAVFTRLWIYPLSVDGRPIDQGNKVLRRLCLMLGTGAGVMLPGIIAGLLARTAEMSGDPILSVLPLLPSVVLKTHYGRIWTIGAAGILLMIIIVATGAPKRNSKAAWYVLLAFGAIVGMTQSATGHAADAGDFSMAEIADWLHLMAAMVWVGGLFALAFAILPLPVIGEPGAGAVADAVARFSAIAGPAACIIAVTAAYNAWLDIGSAAALAKTEYGRTAIVKIILFGLVLAIAVFNRFVALPWLRNKAGKPAVPEETVLRFVVPVRLRLFQALNRNGRLFNRAVKAEALFMLALLLCAVMMRHEVPAKHAAHMGTTGEHVHEHK